MAKFIDYSKEPMLFPELEKQIIAEEVTELEENYKTITEVAKDLELATSVIRYWETKFPAIDPIKRNNRRYYSNQSQKIISNIKNLLYIQGYTIKAVQDIMSEGKLDKLSAGYKSAKDNSKNNIKDIIKKLEQIRDML